MDDTVHHVVILGGGFGGLYVAQTLRNAPVKITLIDKRNFHLFQPLLYQVATGALSPANIAAPLRAVLKRQANIDVWLGEATDIDVSNKRVLLKDGAVTYDTLVIATGSQNAYFGHTEWEALAPGLKTIEDATRMRSHILSAFEQAERSTNPKEQQAWLTFVIVGAGPTGVELAGALGEIAHHTLTHNFRHIDPARARIILLEGASRVLPTYPENLSAHAKRTLERFGIDVRTHTKVTQISKTSVMVMDKSETETTIPTHTILWAAGVAASPLAQALSHATSAPLDRMGRIPVQPDLTVLGHPEIFVIGDLAHCIDHRGSPLPGVAPVAIQQGKYVAHMIAARLKQEQLPSFRYRDWGNMATIGRSSAVAELGRLHLTGLVGWLAWLFVHLMSLVVFENRVLVLVQWAWSYITRNRSARLITHRDNPSPMGT